MLYYIEGAAVAGVCPMSNARVGDRPLHFLWVRYLHPVTMQFFPSLNQVGLDIRVIYCWDSGMLTYPQHAHKNCIIQCLTPSLSSLFCHWLQTLSQRCLVLPCPWSSHHLFAQEGQEAENAARSKTGCQGHHLRVGQARERWGNCKYHRAEHR